MAINKVIYDGETLMDVTEDTVTPETLAKGITAHGANGEPIVGLLPTVTEEEWNGKVNVSDIVNNLTTNSSNKPLSAAQGIVLKGLVDDLGAMAANAVNIAVEATTEAGTAKSTADEAKTAAQNAGTTAGEAKTLAQSASQTAANASNKVDGLEKRMNDGEFEGEQGRRGTGLLAVTTAPSSYTTTVNGLTPAYRISLSAVKSQASVDEVFAGDTIRYSYYHYPIIYVDSSYVYCGARVSIRGATGAAATIAIGSVTTGAAGSSASVTNSGTTAAAVFDFVIPKGDKGDKGDTYTLTEADKAEIVQMVHESIGTPIFGVVDSDNEIVLTGQLADGTYSIKYEMENGNKVNIGNLVLDTKTYYSVTKNLTYCTINNSATKVAQGESYSATISANSGYTLKTVSVTMGGSAVTVTNGVINISSVTGNIVITAVAEVVAPSYTDLANTFQEGRFDSSGNVATNNITHNNVHCCMDYIGKLSSGDVVRIKGMGNLSQYFSVWYNASKAVYSAGKLNAMSETGSRFSYAYDSTNDIVTITKLDAQAGYSYLRVSGVVTKTTADVVITINEPIV